MRLRQDGVDVDGAYADDVVHHFEVIYTRDWCWCCCDGRCEL